ncbi:hypothetical protein N1027_18025 [Herbiconiux sp. CPCC 205763]|uniref:Uncharacterized protein n=1 Tax=Herbiconiux aconitum TaxID=2970913 RepID=A0ABT2GWU0_9MICO|nr:hypothetical protein [Herbiconiux aconitum]MCS5720032.1 hypothetical protein [Herbiconiux aconitum]
MTSSDSGEVNIDSKVAFVVSPIGQKGTQPRHLSDLALTYIFRKALTSPEWTVIRGDEETSTDSISTQIVERILTADLVIADLTGHNANVFYELAVAHGYKRPVIQVISEGESIPFDIADQRTIVYNLADPASVDASINAIQQAASWLEDKDLFRNPLSTRDAFQHVASAGGSSGELADVLESLLTQMSGMARSIALLERRDRVGRDGIAVGRAIRSDGQGVRINERDYQDVDEYRRAQSRVVRKATPQEEYEYQMKRERDLERVRELDPELNPDPS